MTLNRIRKDAIMEDNNLKRLNAINGRAIFCDLLKQSKGFYKLVFVDEDNAIYNIKSITIDDENKIVKFE